MEDTLTRLLDVARKAESPSVPPSLFTPAGPRLGVSGSMSKPPPKPKLAAIAPVPPPPPPPSAPLAPVPAEDEDQDDDDEDQAAMSSLSSGEDSREHVKENEYDEEDPASSNSDDEEPMLEVKRPPTRRYKRTRVGMDESEEPLDYEGRIRRALKMKPEEPLPEIMRTWSKDTLTEEEMARNQLVETKINYMACSGNTTVMAIRQCLQSYAPQGVGPLWVDGLKSRVEYAHFADLKRTEDILKGCYSVGETEQ
jgi:hypothetical protein